MPTGQNTSWQPSLSPTTIATFSSSAKIHQKPDKIPNFTPQLSSLFWGLPRWTELDKKYPFQPALQFHRNWQDLSCSAREKEIGNFSPLTWRGALFHLGIFASCHSCARKETISSLSSLKVVAQEAYCVPDDLELVWWLAVLATPTIKVWWKMLKSESWLTVPPPKEKVFVRCPGRDSIFGRESFLRVTILPTSGKLPISMPPHAHAHAFPFSYANPNSQNDAFKFHLRLVSSSHTIS